MSGPASLPISLRGTWDDFFNSCAAGTSSDNRSRSRVVDRLAVFVGSGFLMCRLSSPGLILGRQIVSRDFSDGLGQLAFVAGAFLRTSSMALSFIRFVCKEIPRPSRLSFGIESRNPYVSILPHRVPQSYVSRARLFTLKFSWTMATTCTFFHARPILVRRDVD